VGEETFVKWNVDILLNWCDITLTRRSYSSADRVCLSSSFEKVEELAYIGGYLAHLRYIDFSPTQKSSLPQHG
jgi:hypothetical protein